MTNTLASLTTEIEQWLAKPEQKNLRNAGSADEMLMWECEDGSPLATPGQQVWLTDFVERWKVCEDEEG